MIVSPGRGYVLVHAPKTGGTALTLALEARAKADDILIGDTPKARRRKGRLVGAQVTGRLWKHSTLRDIRGLLSDAVLDGLRPIMLVRNPWDRVVSYYHWLKCQTFEHPAVQAAKCLTFDAFLRDPGVAQSFRANPYASYVAGGRDPIFVRLEHLADDLAPVEALLGFAIDMPVANQSDRERDWRGYYDGAGRDRVADFCGADISAFSYRFDGSDPA